MSLSTIYEPSGSGKLSFGGSCSVFGLWRNLWKSRSALLGITSCFLIADAINASRTSLSLDFNFSPLLRIFDAFEKLASHALCGRTPSYYRAMFWRPTIHECYFLALFTQMMSMLLKNLHRNEGSM